MTEITAQGAAVSDEPCSSCVEAWCCGRCSCCPPAQHRVRVRLLRVGALLARQRRSGPVIDRTRYESHAWGGGADGQECVACGVTWEDCEGECRS